MGIAHNKYARLKKYIGDLDLYETWFVRSDLWDYHDLWWFVRTLQFWDSRKFRILTLEGQNQPADGYLIIRTA